MKQECEQDTGGEWRGEAEQIIQKRRPSRGISEPAPRISEPSTVEPLRKDDMALAFHGYDTPELFRHDAWPTFATSTAKWLSMSGISTPFWRESRNGHGAHDGPVLRQDSNCNRKGSRPTTAVRVSPILRLPFSRLSRGSVYLPPCREALHILLRPRRPKATPREATSFFSFNLQGCDQRGHYDGFLLSTNTSLGGQRT